MKSKILTLGTIIAFVTGSTFITSCGTSTNEGSDATEQHDEETLASTHVCPMHPDITGLEGDKCSKCGMDLVETKKDTSAIASCPMHPEITGKEGDKCSKCGMDLVLADASVDHQHQ